MPWLKRGRPLEWLVGTGAVLGTMGFAGNVLLGLQWLLVGGSMERSVHLIFAITTACIAGVFMVLTGFVLKLLLDNLDERHAF